MKPSHNQPLSEDQINIAIYLADKSFLERVLCHVSGQDHGHDFPSSVYPCGRTVTLSVPRTGADVVKLIMDCKLECPMLLEACVELGFEPSRVVVPLENRDITDGQQTGFVKFLEAIHEGKTLIHDRARIVAIFEWFIKLQDNVHSPSASDLGPMTTNHLTEPGRPRPPIDHLTEMLKWQTTGPTIQKHGVRLTCEMIEKMCAKGAVIDLYQDRFLSDQQTGELKRPNNAVEIAMMPQCPESFLQDILSSRTDEEQEFVAESPAWRSSGADLPRGMHYAVTNMEWIVTRIHRDIFNGTEYVSGPLRIGHEYRAKLALLDSPKWTDNTELQALKNLVEAVEDILHQIETVPSASRGDEFEAHSWFRLCHAISCLATNSHRAEYEESSKYFGDRRHRFVVDASWDPRFQWMEGEIDRLVLNPSSRFARVSRDEVASLWRQMILERSEFEWWDVKDEYGLYVPVWAVDQALEYHALDRIASLSL
ncbi:hypothetical protein FLAG1_10897 [Fusarium langsethiae]|uniref:Uncharacterized protein n=1 Tax=Fusarium langsethiae TaxID=179993 RepID=A0A0M9EMX1_FUSLA|nr:hypothetical protein FLAG1_10897 [Fusarium langsethiae]GKU14765.1 unnamed protein product [Fusarium langsethiae]